MTMEKASLLWDNMSSLDQWLVGYEIDIVLVPDNRGRVRGQHFYASGRRGPVSTRSPSATASQVRTGRASYRGSRPGGLVSWFGDSLGRPLFPGCRCAFRVGQGDQGIVVCNMLSARPGEFLVTWHTKGEPDSDFRPAVKQNDRFVAQVGCSGRLWLFNIETKYTEPRYIVLRVAYASGKGSSMFGGNTSGARPAVHDRCGSVNWQ